eukprot:TRINITY_DN301_c0_g1_i2.p4 TRINITY_DN301_c0_g1~~TRINITY_DN301_c0_g1_i2.p4  ORF type:complete len:249 (+),score=85.30 TRINITY_DN301_c0_g1_i2:127-873(+)
MLQAAASPSSSSALFFVHRRCASTAAVERTLLLVKPDGVVRRQAGVEVVKAVLSLGPERASVACFRPVAVPAALARAHYAEHAAKPFFPWLVEMATAQSGVLAMVLVGGGVVERVRAMLGPTMVEKARATAAVCLRGAHGLVAGVNLAHASDSPASGAREVALWDDALALKLPQFDAATGMGYDGGRAAAEDYVKRYDNKHPSRAEAQRLAAEVASACRQLRDALLAESDAPAEHVNALVRVVAGSRL